MVFSLQVCVAVTVRSLEPARSVAVELRHGAAVSDRPGPQPLEHQQGGEQDGKTAMHLSVHTLRKGLENIWIFFADSLNRNIFCLVSVDCRLR